MSPTELRDADLGGGGVNDNIENFYLVAFVGTQVRENHRCLHSEMRPAASLQVRGLDRLDEELRR